MKIKPIVAAIAAGLVITSSAFAATTNFPAPLPGFKSDSELAEWRNDLIAKAEAEEAAGMAARETSRFFYTGKPFVEEVGEYTFLYRNYNPELARWSSHDPSGFPDGANNLAYMAVPTMEFDWLGCVTVSGTEDDQAANPLGYQTILGGPQKIGPDTIAQGQKNIVWKLNDPNFNGWIIQEAKLTIEVWNRSDDSLVTSPQGDHYWEAWQVSNGAIVDGGGLDRFTTPAFTIASTYGSAGWTGDAKLFVLSNDFGDNHPISWSKTEVALAHGLRATRQEPAWWSTGGTGSASHFLTVSWE